ncbi:MAG: tetratricopeptide repeat protein [Xenococcaceae cyanobacterium MO_207.B15]|nr:tetratricopeptide repeat protein [Xenococcaceae cyanobacterium MO_207.B15]MDJ0743211.1 tetratricopeptide repeat protein [Xenococcaceae cyanobacterium MO_167.B27]
MYQEIEAIKIWEKYNKQVVDFYKQNNYLEAIKCAKEGLKIAEKIMFKDNLCTTRSLKTLGGLLVITHQYQEALARFTEAVAVENKITRKVFACSSEVERMRHLNQIRNTTEILLSLVVTHFQNNPEAIKTAFDVVIQRNLFSVAAISAFDSVICEPPYQHLTDQWEQWRDIEEHIAYLTFNQTTTKEREGLKLLQQESERLEKYLASQIAAVQLQDPTINRYSIARRLPIDSVLVEFFRFNLYDFRNKYWASPYHIAFVLPAGQPEKVKMQVLGKAVKIEPLIQMISRIFPTAYVNTPEGKIIRLSKTTINQF